MRIQLAARRDDLETPVPAARPGSRAASVFVSSCQRLLPVAALAALWFLPALWCFAQAAVDDPDLGWHLRTGEWIVARGAWPVTDEFSAAAGRPWIAYSWLFEVLMYLSYQLLGLRGLALLTAGLTAAIQWALFGLLWRHRQNLVLAGGLSLLAAGAMVPLFTPRPWLASIVCLTVELDLLLSAAQARDHRRLLWLLPLFCLWANLHIQFTVGLALLGLAAAERVLARWDRWGLTGPASRALSPWKLAGICSLCVGATLLNPYHYHLYEVARELLGQNRLWNAIHELMAMPFRLGTHWLVLGVTAGALMVIGWRRRVRLLLLLAFAAAVYLGFRSQRDVWLILVVGTAVLATGAASSATADALPFRLQRRALAVVLGLLLVGCFSLSNAGLEAKLARRFPAGAVKFLREGAWTGPLFNPFDWGGYLVFAFPELRVSIDGRTLVHGQERVLRDVRTLRGLRGWRDDPDLQQAALVLLPQEGPLACLLEMDSAFHEIYRDGLAVVFQHRPVSPHPNAETSVAQFRGH